MYNILNDIPKLYLKQYKIISLYQCIIVMIARPSFIYADLNLKIIVLQFVFLLYCNNYKNQLSEGITVMREKFDTIQNFLM